MSTTQPPSKAILWVSWILSVLIALLMTFSAVMKLMGPKEMVDQWVGKMGYPLSTLIPIGIVEVLCVIIYLIPRTAVLGAILHTGYLGGAIATTVRIGDNFIATIVIGVLVWFALFLRDSRVRNLIPLRKKMDNKFEAFREV